MNRHTALISRLLGGLLLLGSGLAFWVWQANLPAALPPPPPDKPAADQRVLGAYLARVGNCAGCHTAPGGAPMAGGRAITTPFGTVYSSNLTPDAETGLGRWTPDDFWRAMHEGRSRDGRLLSPAFPYTSYTRLSRADSDALLRHLQSLAPIYARPRPHALRWPYGSQPALALWRALYFRPAEYEADPNRDAAWNRGAYLSQGLAHCNACHASRNALGAPQGGGRYDGGPLPGLAWHAPSLHRADEGGVQAWPASEIEAFLRSGVAAQGIAQGPMAEVVTGSTRHLSENDLQAMARYLKALPLEPDRPAATAASSPGPAQARLGAALYRTHCQSCHGAQGEGRTGAYPPLRGSRLVTQASPLNLLRLVQLGGFAPSSPAHPQPFGMPPFAGQFDAEELAALLSHVRNSWGQQGGSLSAPQIQALTNGTSTNP